MNSNLIPPNIEGKQNDLRHSVTAPDRNEAVNTFKRACERMLSPGMWHDLCGSLSATFTLVDKDGHRLQRQARDGDYIRIDIPGPGIASGGGYDWVKIEEVERNGDIEGREASCGMRVRPCKNPQDDGKRTAHFFKGTATSTFLVQRSGNTVSASYHGRNEVANLETGNVLDNIRNAVVTSGALAGLSELQWHTLIRAFVEEEVHA